MQEIFQNILSMKKVYIEQRPANPDYPTFKIDGPEGLGCCIFDIYELNLKNREEIVCLVLSPLFVSGLILIPYIDKIRIFYLPKMKDK